MDRILHLTLHKKWFKDILEGKKTVEYREKKPYWTRRLFERDGTPKTYDFVVFRNGYDRDAPWMKVEYLGVQETDTYELKLGRILESRNLERLSS